MADHVTWQATAAYLKTLESKLAARTKPGSEKTMPGYKLNVQALRKEIGVVSMRLARQKAAYQEQLDAEKAQAEAAPPAG